MNLEFTIRLLIALHINPFFTFSLSIRHISKIPRSRFDLSNQRDGMGESASNGMEGLADSSSDLTYSPGAVQEVNGSSKYNKSFK